MDLVLVIRSWLPILIIIILPPLGRLSSGNRLLLMVHINRVIEFSDNYSLAAITWIILPTQPLHQVQFVASDLAMLIYQRCPRQKFYRTPRSRRRRSGVCHVTFFSLLTMTARLAFKWGFSIKYKFNNCLYQAFAGILHGSQGRYTFERLREAVKTVAENTNRSWCNALLLMQINIIASTVMIVVGMKTDVVRNTKTSFDVL